jgi:hypothetical protein
MDFLGSSITRQDVADDEDLFRRVTVSNWIIPESDGSTRPSSALYKSTSPDISVDIASRTTPQTSIQDALALACISATEPKKLGYPVVEAPLPDNPAHALIKGKITRSHARQLAQKSTWAIPPKR